MQPALLDTDILSELLKGRDLRVIANSKEYLAEHHRLAFSEFTVYEVVRGYQSKRSSQQIADFLLQVESSDVYPVSRPTLLRAADLWVEAVSGGHPKQERT